jgi:diguanylate cyclase (GGDEF)-like protein
MSTPAENEDSLQSKLTFQLMDSFVKQTPTVLSGHAVVATVSALIFWGQINHHFVLGWALVMLLTLAARYWLTARFKRQPERWNSVQWNRHFALTSLALGLIWCVWSLYVTSAIQYSGIGLHVVVITAAGLVAGAVASTAASMLAYFCFSAPALLPLSLLLIMHNQNGVLDIGILLVAFFVFNLTQVRKINGIFTESIVNRLKLEESQKQAELLAQELYQLSTQDALTLVTNRRGFDEALVREWKRAKRTNSPLTLLMLDVDFFKNFNDSLGHPAGDKCLQAIGSKLKEFARREGDVVARYGGEEFAILLPAIDADHVLQLAQDIVDSIAELAIPHPASAISDRVTMSIGIKTVSPSECDGDASGLIKAADMALYQAKAGGRNCFKLAA